MKKSIISIAKELNGQLIKVHDISTLVEKKESDAIPKFRSWLFETEKVLKKYNMPQVAQLATIRAQTANWINDSKSKRRKSQFHFISTTLTQAQEHLWNATLSFNHKKEIATDQINHLLNIIYQSNAFHFDGKSDLTGFLESIWDFCTKNEQLHATTVQILSQINKTDVLMIMAEEIDLNELS